MRVIKALVLVDKSAAESVFPVAVCNATHVGMSDIIKPHMASICSVTFSKHKFKGAMITVIIIQHEISSNMLSVEENPDFIIEKTDEIIITARQMPKFVYKSFEYDKRFAVMVSMMFSGANFSSTSVAVSFIFIKSFVSESAGVVSSSIVINKTVNLINKRRSIFKYLLYQWKTHCYKRAFC